MADGLAHIPQVVDRKKHPVGRPSTYDPAYCDAIREYFAQPLEKKRKVTKFNAKGKVIEGDIDCPVELPTLAGFCCQLGIGRRTLNQWIDKHPEFAQAVDEARQHQERILAANGLAGRYNAQFAGLIAQAVLGWQTKTTVEHTGTVTHRAQLPSGGEISAYLDNLKAISSGAVPDDVIDVEAEPVALPAPERGPEAG